MYSITEIEKDIDGNFGSSNTDISSVIKAVCNEILDLSIEEACIRIKEIRGDYKNTQALPLWFRKLVFLVIYNYYVPYYRELEEKKLSGNRVGIEKPISQGVLLKKMGLTRDIFRETHWNMYSPDMKAQQQVYIPMKLPLNYSEVECNDVYRAMIHYMVTCADVVTDTFVDVFGKQGVTSMFCANGYKNREVWLDDTRMLTIFSDTMQHDAVKVYKKIAHIQKYIKALKVAERGDFVKNLLDTYFDNQFVAKRSSLESIDKVECSAEFFFVNCFSLGYCLDSTLVEEENEEGDNILVVDLDTVHISRESITRFINFSKEDFLYLASQYKRISIKEIDIRKFSKDVVDYFYNTDYLHTILEDSYDLLYVDIPKYLQENERYNFSFKDLANIFEFLNQYRGNWILTWKNYDVNSYLDKLDDKVDIVNSFKKEKLKDMIVRYSDLKQKYDSLKKGFEQQRKSSNEELNDIQAELCYLKPKINKMKKVLGDYEDSAIQVHKYFDFVSREMADKLWVFKYRDKNTHNPNSIVFITNIDFDDITFENFKTKYFPEETFEGVLTKETFTQFRRYAFETKVYI